MKTRLWLWFFVVGMLWLPASSIIAQDSASNATPNVTIHVVQRGETLYGIALSYGLTVQDLASLNGISDPTNIQVGQHLLVPVAVTVSNLPATHTVQAGETLRSIANLYGLTVEQLAAQNNISDVNRIYVGQVLNIAPTPTAEPTAPATSVAQLPGQAGQNLIHTVVPGETLFRIATSFGLTVNDLATANNIADPTLIYAGEQLIIPGVKPPQLALDLPSVVSSLDVMPLIFVEGETGRIRLTTTIPMNISGSFLNRTIAVASEQNNTQDTILVGIPVFTNAGIYPLSLTLTDASGQQTNLNLNIQIVSGSYGNEHINLSSSENYLLDPTVEGPELNMVGGIMSQFTPTRYWNGPMGLPAAAGITSPFGRKRSYNGGPFDHYHMGTDFGGAPGTPILAAASGYIVLAQRLDVRGNATIIDHGWGVFTGYWHQTEQYVKVGDFVTAGQVIGTIGSTGRVTGPHLHWELWVNGVPVDPLQWVQQSFS
jgi:murein DD-endopeptidase MepM/ murein hydrolase activator NlpD